MNLSVLSACRSTLSFSESLFFLGRLLGGLISFSALLFPGINAKVCLLDEHIVASGIAFRSIVICSHVEVDTVKSELMCLQTGEYNRYNLPLTGTEEKTLKNQEKMGFYSLTCAKRVSTLMPRKEGVSKSFIWRRQGKKLRNKGEKYMTYEEAVKSIPLGRYRHFKGNEYEVIAIARHSETEEAMVVYRALYGEGGVWVRPAQMWNENVEREGKTYRRFYRLDRIRRVEKYEQLFDEALASHDPGKIPLLETYYTSGQWQEDYEADERGELPPEMKRGVLSQDLLYDLLEERK